MTVDARFLPQISEQSAPDGGPRGDLLTPVFAQPDRQPVLTPPQWETVIGQARNARLLARLAHHHLQRGWLDRVPPGPR
ncbi:MAG: hypothetical protein M3Y32_00305, partial [Pseudomonadota bacterium]|nr:hypothetical protein [Pseudomonadota bacterium]